MLAPPTLAMLVQYARPVWSMDHTLVVVLAATRDLNVTTTSTNAMKVRRAHAATSLSIILCQNSKCIYFLKKYRLALRTRWDLRQHAWLLPL